MTLNIGVFGLGFVGLTTALGFAEKGFLTRGFDVNESRLKNISNGKLPFLEPGLDEALTRNLNKNFIPATTAAEAAKESDVLFLCVGTPRSENGSSDLSFVFSVLDSIIPVLSDNRYRVLVIKSTVPPGTAQNEILPYLHVKKISGNFSLANNPEFLREGKCWDDFIKPDRIVCGSNDERAGRILKIIYQPFNAPLHIVSLNTAEFIKYLSNTMLAAMISFSNEMSMISDKIGNIDTGHAFRILHEDKRLKNSGIADYIYPGCGYGGYCLPKDTLAMAEKAKQYGFTPQILEKVIEVNEGMPSFFADKIKSSADKNEKIGILGLSFKPESDDVRDSASAKIIALLKKDGYKNINVHDPAANKTFNDLYHFENIKYFTDKNSLCSESDIIVLVTAWEEYRRLRSEFPRKKWIDCRYFLG
ncbi:MAG: nucleotide sugar dehydrogenase [Treponema sp.]|nr:nucleotide sugar dehydrogenase [Treponema sp.]